MSKVNAASSRSADPVDNSNVGNGSCLDVILVAPVSDAGFEGPSRSKGGVGSGGADGQGASESSCPAGPQDLPHLSSIHDIASSDWNVVFWHDGGFSRTGKMMASGVKSFVANVSRRMSKSNPNDIHNALQNSSGANPGASRRSSTSTASTASMSSTLSLSAANLAPRIEKEDADDYDTVEEDEDDDDDANDGKKKLTPIEDVDKGADGKRRLSGFSYAKGTNFMNRRSFLGSDW